MVGQMASSTVLSWSKGRNPASAIHRAELILLKRRGRLYRGDMMAGLLTVDEVSRIANMRFSEGQSTTEIIPE